MDGDAAASTTGVGVRAHPLGRFFVDMDLMGSSVHALPLGFDDDTNRCWGSCG